MIPLRVGMVQCLLSLLALTGSVRAADAAIQSTDDFIYEQAHLYLLSGKREEAIKNLSTLVERSPLHLGALLDLAIVYCQSNRSAEAQDRFDRLMDFSELPPVIAQLISDYREQCRPVKSVWRSFATAGIGYARNFNQGGRVDYFFIAPINMTLQLEDSILPRNAGFRIIEAGVSTSDSSSGWHGGIFVQDIDYNGSSDYDNILADAKLGYRFKNDDFDIGIVGNISHLSIGKKSYLTSASTSISVMRPVSHDKSWEVGAAGNFTDRNYLNMPNYRAHVVDVRGLLQWRPSTDLTLLGEVGLISDVALKNRPGGNTNGPVFQLTGQWLLSPRQSLDILQRQTWLSDQSAYSPAFFGDLKRRPHLASWYAAWRYQLREDLLVRLTGRYGRNQEKLSFLDYRASTFSIALEWWPK